MHKPTPLLSMQGRTGGNQKNFRDYFPVDVDVGPHYRGGAASHDLAEDLIVPHDKHARMRHKARFRCSLQLKGLLPHTV